MLKDILALVPEECLPQISDFLKILLTSVFTYLVTRYSLNNPRQLQIKQKQFGLVYLPLYKIIKQLKPLSIITNDEVSTCVNQILDITNTHYEFVFPQLHKLIAELNTYVNFDAEYKNTLEDIIYQIEFDYEQLKRVLGYPSQNIFQAYRRLKTKDKVQLILASLLLITTVFLINGILLALMDHSIGLLAVTSTLFLFIMAFIRILR